MGGNTAQWLMRPTDAASLALFRIVFGGLLAFETFTKYLMKVPERYDPDRFHFTYPWFEWVQPWPGIGTYLHIIVMGIAAAMIMLGAWYRAATIVFFFTYTHLFLIEKAAFNNHYYFICLLGFLFAITNAHYEASWDNTRRPETNRHVVPLWHILIFRAQIVIVYFYGGIAKLNGDWLRGEPVRGWLRDRADYPVMGALFTQEWFVWFMTYGGLLFDLSIGWMLLYRRTRVLGVIGLCFFHLTNAYVWEIGIFPWLGLGATVIFFEPATVRRWLVALKLAEPLDGMQAPILPQDRRRGRAAVVAFVAVYLLVQLLVPFRHWLYPGNVSWTEEGHHFAWHMKLRDKATDLSYVVRDAATGEEVNIGREQMIERLTRRQYFVMKYDPPMMLQFAHQLHDEFAAAGMKQPQVFARAQCSLNGRPFQLLIDPEIDLAQVEMHWFAPSTWILPLEEGLQIGLYPTPPAAPGEGSAEVAEAVD